MPTPNCLLLLLLVNAYSCLSTPTLACKRQLLLVYSYSYLSTPTPTCLRPLLLVYVYSYLSTPTPCQEIYWQLGNVTCSAYPLRYLDTIHSDTGELNTISALNLIVFGPKLGHLDLIEYVVVDLLRVKRRFQIWPRQYVSGQMEEFCQKRVLQATLYFLHLLHTWNVCFRHSADT